MRRGRVSQNLEDRRNQPPEYPEDDDINLDEIINDTYLMHPTSIINKMLENQVPFFSPYPLTNIRTLQETTKPDSLTRKQSRLKRKT